MYTATDLMVLEIAKLKIDQESIGIAFPDDGAHKRYSSQFGNLDNIICNKVRKGNERIVTIREGEVKDRHVFIIDDLVHSGGTLIECAKVIKSQGAKSIHAFCAHAIFEGAAWKKFADGGPGSIFDTFYITDTHPMAHTLRTIKPFKVLTIAPLLVPILTDTELQ